MKKFLKKAVGSTFVLALTVLIVSGMKQSVYAAAICSDPWGLGIFICADTEQCDNAAGCSCNGTTIASGSTCSFAIPPCTFNSVPFLSGQTTRGYRYNFIPYSSIALLGRPTDISNKQAMTCNADGTRTPAIGAFIYSTGLLIAPTEGYCTDTLGLGIFICADKQRCDNAAGCSCNGTGANYTQQCHFTCASGIQTISTGHSYTIPTLWYGSSVVASSSSGITNGTLQYNQSFVCLAGTISLTGTETTTPLCNSSYTRNGTSCVSAGGGSNGGGGGGGSSYTATCTIADLMCTNGSYQKKPGTSCQGGNLGLACSIGSGTTTGIVLSGSIIGSPYSSELNNAYLRAYANGITTMNTIQKADMGDTLIRSHMAKMISNFAIRLGGLTLHTGTQCNFSDIANQSTEMKTYIKLSCQLGLMGVNMTNFNPNDTITRSQFGTILSRLVWGTTYNKGTPYYLAHLQALKLAGIMTQISNPNMEEIRGYVMLMMMRTYQGGFLKK